MLTLGQCATLACVFEASAPKVGNVHRGADFEDMTYVDLITAAVAIAPSFDAAEKGATVGTIIHSAVDAMCRAVACPWQPASSRRVCSPRSSGMHPLVGRPTPLLYNARYSTER